MTEAARSWRDGPIYWGIACFCIVMTTIMVCYEIWMHKGVYEIKGYRIEEVNVLKFRCSPEHFWGQLVYYKRLDDDYLRTGHVCRDWAKGEWILYDQQYYKGIIPNDSRGK